ncbi:MAG: hypothetical protein IPJ04_00510 [Candidatus Eisenbacteria bacterium]|nr:hypothetical protein [Candidatus Eisenbacteria bacterium]
MYTPLAAYVSSVSTARSLVRYWNSRIALTSPPRLTDSCHAHVSTPSRT